MATEKKRAGVVISVKRERNEELGTEWLSFKLHGEPTGEDGKDVPVLDEIRFEPTKASSECRAYAEWHGWEQRLRDAAAKPCDKKTGKSASPKEKFAAIRRLADYYLGGAVQWNLATRVAGVAQQSDDKQMLKAALAEYLPSVGKNRTPEQIHAAVEEMNKGQVSALLANEKIAEIVLRLREEKAVEMEVDAEELLDGI